MAATMAAPPTWWTAEQDSVHERVIDYVWSVERAQYDLYNKFAKLEALYDPNAPGTRTLVSTPAHDQLSQVTENVVASNIDTVTAIISATDIRARFMTDDADWSTQRRARHLEWYAETLGVSYDLPAKCRSAFRDAAMKGTGLLKIYANQNDELIVERVLVDDIIVDELECRAGLPKQMHQRIAVDRDELKTLFPEYEDEIDAAQSQLRGNSRNWRLWAGYRPVERNEVIVIESWRLPVGKRSADGRETKRYKPGRHSIVIDGCTLLDEQWTASTFPFVRMVWSERVNGWFGISLAERISGIQLALNRRNWQIDRALQQGAVPTTWVRLADANIAVKTVNRFGTIGVYKGDIPKTEIPPAVSSETYNSRTDLKNSAFEESGVSRMTAQASKPAGIDSGVAMREYRDQTTQRFSLQEKYYERFYLDAVVACLDVCKQLGKDAPTMMRRSKFGIRRLEWAKIEIPDVRVMIAAASTLSKTPAGRMQTVLEWAQAGVISMDEARRLMRHPDLERSMSIYTEALENVEEMFERIEDGEICMPEPYQNLKMLVWRGQMEYMKIQGDGAPEEILEALRAAIVQAAYILNPPAPPMPVANSNMGALPGAIPNATQVNAPLPNDPSSGVMQAAAMPGNAAAVSALAPQSLALQAI